MSADFTEDEMQSEPPVRCIELLEARCVFCGYNGPGYWQPFTHPKPCPWHDIGGMDQRLRAIRRIVHAHYVRASND